MTAGSYNPRRPDGRDVTIYHIRGEGVHEARYDFGGTYKIIGRGESVADALRALADNLDSDDPPPQIDSIAPGVRHPPEAFADEDAEE